MDWPFLHLLFNHFPIVLSVVAAGMSILALVMGRPFLWMFAMTSLVLAAIATVPAFLTGNQAERVMEKVWYVSRAAIHDHEEAGELALWVVLASGVAAAYGLWRSSRPAAPGRYQFPAWLQALVVLAAFASAGVIGFAAWSGGKIVHKSPALERAPAATRSRSGVRGSSSRTREWSARAPGPGLRSAWLASSQGW